MKRMHFSVSIVVVLCLFLTGCTQQQSPVVEVVTQLDSVESDYDTVSLSEIHPPKFEKDFASLIVGSYTRAVYWGTGDGCVMWKESGYPGFDYPMIIEIDFELLDDEHSLLITQWGQYEYVKEIQGTAFEENNNLVDKCTGDFLINWNDMGEVLVLWNRLTQEYVKFRLTGGTEIVP